MATKTPFQKVLDLAGNFVAKHDGSWDHAGWEELQSAITNLGYALDDEGRRHLGNIIEAGKYFYNAPVAKPKRQRTRRVQSAD